MPAYTFMNEDGSTYIQVNAETRVGPFATPTDAMMALMPIIEMRFADVDEGLRRLQEAEARRTILPPEAA